MSTILQYCIIVFFKQWVKLGGGQVTLPCPLCPMPMYTTEGQGVKDSGGRGRRKEEWTVGEGKEGGEGTVWGGREGIVCIEKEGREGCEE